ncbi:MAG: hypothetical protein EP314_03715 [Bacteroidetes bacterium]|nr:MAG: hypothetical protein EP314_03715 [Bacteroidota bacterium]
MITSELTAALQPPEWDELGRFVQFRYPRIRKDVFRMMEALRQRKGDAVSRKALHHQLYPGKPFNDKAIRYLLTDVNRCLYEYFAYKQLQEQPHRQELLLLDELRSRKCEKAFSKEFKRSISALDKSNQCHADALLHRSELLRLNAASELGSGQRSSESFEESSLYLDQYFVARKLQISAEKINLHYILSKQLVDPFLETIIEQVDRGLFSDVPSIGLYRTIIQSLTEPNDESVFPKLKQQVLAQQDEVPASELTDLYQYLLNYCIRSINAGKLSFQEELFSVYRSALETGALLNNGTLSQWDFKNVVTIALRTGHVEYAREFIHGYRNALPAQQRANALAYNLANLHFHEKNYRAAIAQLQKVDLDDIFYQLDARSILMKSYYELDDTDALFYHATAFRSLLKRNRKISDHQRKLYLNLIKHTVSLARTSDRNQRVANIRSRISADPNVADLKWLEAKLSEISS